MPMTYPPNFRFYHYESEKIYPVLNICFQGTPTVTVAYNPVKKYRLDSGVLMQMTFLLDKKGHVLYEDDIICTTDNIIGVVKFGDYGCNEWEGWGTWTIFELVTTKSKTYKVAQKPCLFLSDQPLKDKPCHIRRCSDQFAGAFRVYRVRNPDIPAYIFRKNYRLNFLCNSSTTLGLSRVARKRRASAAASSFSLKSAFFSTFRPSA